MNLIKHFAVHENMIEKKECIVCGMNIIVINCHYTCENCGFSENCHDIPHITDKNDKEKNRE